MTVAMREALERRGRQWGEDNNLRLHSMRQELRELCRRPIVIDTAFAGRKALGGGCYVVSRYATTTD